MIIQQGLSRIIKVSLIHDIFFVQNIKKIALLISVEEDVFVCTTVEELSALTGKLVREKLVIGC